MQVSSRYKSTFTTFPHWQVVSIPRISYGYSLQVLKQLTIVTSETLLQAYFIQEITFKTSTTWIMSVTFILSLILEITSFKSFLRYLSLKFLMIPASNGWSLEVVLFGKNMTLMLEYRSLKLSDGTVRYP